jgi:hypothetical protein
MTSRRSNTSARGDLIVRLGRLLMALVAGEDLRVRQVIAQAVTRARPDRDLDMKTRWHVRHDPTASPRVE